MMTGKFEIKVDLNGWLVPMLVEKKGSGVFKVAYEDMTLGYLVENEGSRWNYVHNVFNEELLNAQTAERIKNAIVSH
jgi:hypothetical protein